MEKILVSACLLGVPCRYDGCSVPCEKALELVKTAQAVPVCPEILGGLPTPRVPAERVGDRVLNREGADVTEAYRRGAEQALYLCRLFGCKTAVLKSRSPSCGCREIYDGTFTGHRVPGMGMTAQLLSQAGVRVLTEEEL